MPSSGRYKGLNYTVPKVMSDRSGGYTIMYRQFIHSIAFVSEKCTCLRPLYLYFLDTPHTYHFVDIGSHEKCITVDVYSIPCKVTTLID
jgi:hypothetical protein